MANRTKERRAARRAATKLAVVLLKKEYSGPTYKFKDVDMDDLRDAIHDLTRELETRLLRGEKAE